MAATTPKKKKITRKAPKRLEIVTFETEIFDGEFVLPKFPPPIGILRRLQKGEVDLLIEWLEEANVDPELIEAIDDLDPDDELESFVKSWTGGQLASAPKSQD